MDALEDLSPREHEVLALMAEGFSKPTASTRGSTSAEAVENRVPQHLQEGLRLPPAADDHRRVLAVLAFLRAS